MVDKVYLVIYDIRDDDNGINERREDVFSSLEKAKNQFNIWVNDDKNGDGGIGYEALNGNKNYRIDLDTETHYFAFEDGYADLNYTEVVIYEKKVK